MLQKRIEVNLFVYKTSLYYFACCRKTKMHIPWRFEPRATLVMYEFVDRQPS